VALRSQSGNGNSVRGRWETFLKQWQADDASAMTTTDSEDWEEYIASPQDVVMTGKYFRYWQDGFIQLPSSAKQGTDSFRIATVLRLAPSAGTKLVPDVCTLSIINDILLTSTPPGSTIEGHLKKVLRGLHRVANYLGDASPDALLPKSPYAFDQPLFWELDGPVWQRGSFWGPCSGSKPAIDVRPIVVRLDLSQPPGSSVYTRNDLSAILQTWEHKSRARHLASGRHVRIIGSTRSQLPGTSADTHISSLAAWLGLQVTETTASLAAITNHTWVEPEPTVCFEMFLSPIAR
jgi:hypothetical protein